MKKNRNIIFSVLAILIAWLFLDFGYGRVLPYQLNTIVSFLGFLLLSSGLIFFVISLKKINAKTHTQKIHTLNFEKQSGKWNKNLYDLCLSNMKSVLSSKYDHEAFGSWQIECENKRLIYDGKDSWLILQNRNINDWNDQVMIKKEELNESNLLALIKSI